MVSDGDFGIGIFPLIWGAFDVICQIYFEGATPGKKGMRIKVVSKEYSTISVAQAVIRAISKVFLWSIVIGYLMVLFSKKKKKFT